MSNKYKDCDEVPNEALCKRLKELSKAVTKGREGLHREFTMRIPAELDRDADLVLSIAARRIESLRQQLEEAKILIGVAKCPCCDGSGTYSDSMGGPLQCQWCDESKALLKKMEKR